MAKYFTTENIYAALKFTGVLATGLYAGGSMYLETTYMPAMLALSDMKQALLQFQDSWPRERQLPVCGVFSGVSGIAIYLLKRDPNDLPWLVGGTAMTFFGVYTIAVIYPNSIQPLLKADPDKEKDGHIRRLLEKFKNYHYPRLLTGIATFIAYTYCFGFK